MTKNHTPGPWIAHNGGIYQARQEGKKLYAEMAVAGVFAEEDIPLIAAAPDLLEAIEKLVNLHCDWDKGSAYVPVAFYEKNKPAIAEARAAIAKARGN